MGVLLAGSARREAVELGSQIKGRAVGTGAGGLTGSSVTSSEKPSQMPPEVRHPSCLPPTAPVSLLSSNFIPIPVMIIFRSVSSRDYALLADRACPSGPP